MPTGQLVASTDGESASLDAGDVVFIRAGSDFRLDGGPEGGTAWVCTTPGLEAVMNDGSRITPPWANEEQLRGAPYRRERGGH